MRRLTERAVDEADVALFVIDARVGVTAADEYFADILRKRAKHVILAANKAEGRAGESGAMEGYGLGLGEPLRISAEHGVGVLKRPYLGMSRSDAELALMTTLKQTLDPGNILLGVTA